MFLFCIEASHFRGLGHLFRSMTLADSLAQNGEKSHFLTNSHKPALEILASRGFSYDITDFGLTDGAWESGAIRRLQPSVWINDRLDTTEQHVMRIKDTGIPVVTFDDRGTGAALSDLNVAALAFDHDDRNPLQGCRILTGAKYIVLNPDIKRFRRHRNCIDSVLLTLGGADTYGVTLKVVRLLKDKPWHVTVLLGPSFAHNDALQEVLPDNYEIRSNVESMAAEMARHDLAVTGGGITPFEANAGGLPCIVVANEPFEVPVGQALQRLGGCRFAGHHLSIDKSVFDVPLDVAKMSQLAMSSIDLDGLQHVVKFVRQLVQQ